MFQTRERERVWERQHGAFIYNVVYWQRWPRLYVFVFIDNEAGNWLWITSMSFAVAASTLHSQEGWILYICFQQFFFFVFNFSSLQFLVVIPHTFFSLRSLDMFFFLLLCVCVSVMGECVFCVDISKNWMAGNCEKLQRTWHKRKYTFHSVWMWIYKIKTDIPEIQIANGGCIIGKCQKCSNADTHLYIYISKQC